MYYKRLTLDGWHYLMVKEKRTEDWEHYTDILGRPKKYTDRKECDEEVADLRRIYGRPSRKKQAV